LTLATALGLNLALGKDIPIAASLLGYR